MCVIEASGVGYSYRRSVAVLEDVNLDVRRGEVIGLVGPNGSGKSTLIRCLLRILVPRGRVMLDGVDMATLSRREIARQIAYVPQAISDHGTATVYESILMGRRPYLNWNVREEDGRAVDEAISLLNLDDLAFRPMRELSGGERQRVILARALVQETGVLLLDEPTSALDILYQMEVMELIRRCAAEREAAVVMAVHDLNLAARYCDRLLLLKGGRVAGFDEPRAILTRERLRQVYGIEVEVHDGGPAPFIVPVRASSNGDDADG
ncbi:MAG: ABC transporter ATP-binding protein [Methanoculleaceae archaeon]